MILFTFSVDAEMIFLKWPVIEPLFGFWRRNMALGAQASENSETALKHIKEHVML